MLKTSGVSKIYDGHVALNHIDLDVSIGEILLFVGSHYSGKSTLLKILAGRLLADKGEISLLGVSPERVTNKIGYLTNQQIDWYKNFTVKQLLEMIGLFKQVNDLEQRVEYWLSFLDLNNQKDIKISKADSFTIMKTLIATELINEPILLVIDNFIEKISIDDKRKIVYLLEQLVDQGIMLVMATDDYLLFNKKTNVYVLEQGSIILKAAVADLEVHNTYKISGWSKKEFISKEVSELSLANELKLMTNQEVRNINVEKLSFREYSIKR